jgi:hypothetical protein
VTEGFEFVPDPKRPVAITTRIADENIGQVDAPCDGPHEYDRCGLTRAQARLRQKGKLRRFPKLYRKLYRSFGIGKVQISQGTDLRAKIFCAPPSVELPEWVSRDIFGPLVGCLLNPHCTKSLRDS